ncbi:hypothetical protein BDN71DRAFT_857386 [Pleurotus eryngii]|uniref:Uncharacterized protein n=1 Tax=Pleurotus eryngii TaxID=5323 RepID=A0A9P6DG80_PLEER|nr:hypothetical protein BDN71DRAFT_857386 [Pleurotus eryngii]
MFGRYYSLQYSLRSLRLVSRCFRFTFLYNVMEHQQMGTTGRPNKPPDVHLETLDQCNERTAKTHAYLQLGPGSTAYAHMTTRLSVLDHERPCYLSEGAMGLAHDYLRFLCCKYGRKPTPLRTLCTVLCRGLYIRAAINTSYSNSFGVYPRNDATSAYPSSGPSPRHINPLAFGSHACTWINIYDINIHPTLMVAHMKHRTAMKTLV